jgi:hypothetical protein
MINLLKNMMKYLVSILIALHGAIHILGFLKAFQLAEIQNLQAPVTKISGLFWLLACGLLCVSAILLLFNKTTWMYLAGAGIIMSTVLILFSWGDAKYGMIPNLIIAIALLISFSGCAFNKKITNETQSILDTAGKPAQEVISKEDLSTLPPSVQSWLSASGIVGKTKPSVVWLKQNFQMKLKPEQEKWHNALAEQYFTPENPAFIWTVRLNMSPVIQIRGRDKFVEGKGEMQIKMNGLINLGKETGPKMDEGTLQRYLGEIVWFPSAALSPYISWEELNATTAKATMNYKGNSGSGIFIFNDHGDVVQYSALRYLGNEPNAKRYEWVISVDEYAEFEGVKIPSKCHATWKLDEGDWTWCILEITDLKYDKNPL